MSYEQAILPIGQRSFSEDDLVSVLCIGDPHFKKNNARLTDAMHEAILAKVKEVEYDMVVILGDTLHDHEATTSGAFCRALDFIEDILDHAPVTLLIGNHDMVNNQVWMGEHSGPAGKFRKTKSAHFFSGLHRWNHTDGGRLTIVDRPTPIEVNEVVWISAVPYVENGRLVEALDNSGEWQQSALVVAHQEIKGCKHGAFISEDGDEWKPEWPLLISGHIHEKQSVGDNVYYPGTPVQHAFGDGANKGLLALHLQTDGSWEREEIPLGIRGKLTIKTSAADLDKVTFKRDADYRVVITGDAVELKGVMSSPLVKEWIEDGVKVVTKVDKVTSESAPRVVNSVERVSYRDAVRQRVVERPDLLTILDSVLRE